MKLKLFSWVVLSAMMLLFSCKKTTPSSPEEESKRAVILKLDLSSIGGSRGATRASIEGSITSDVGMQKMDIYLYDKSSGLIYNVMNLDEAQLTAATSTNGLQINNLHGNVDAVAIVCNDTPNKGLNTTANTNISTLFAKEINISLEQDFLTLTYLGKDDALTTVAAPSGGSGDIDYFEAEVTVVPLVARIEVSNILVKPNTTTKFSSLLMNSIYVENVYKDGMRLDYLDNFAASNPSTHMALASDAEGSTQYWWLEVLKAPNTSAYLSTTAWSPKYGSPAENGVFAFHVFQKTSAAPTIGLQLSSYTEGGANDGTGNLNPTPQYMRFDTYTDGAGENVDYFKAGHIYKIIPKFEHDEVNNFRDATGEIVILVTVQSWTIHDNIIAGK